MTRFQCGFCTPGQIMSAIGLIHEGQAGDDPERVREGMSGNLCRCGAYAGIVEAVLEAQKAITDSRPEALRMNTFRLRQAGDDRRSRSRPPQRRARPISPPAPTCST